MNLNFVSLIENISPSIQLSTTKICQRTLREKFIIASGVISKDCSYQQRKKFFIDGKHYFLEDPFLFKRWPDQIIYICAPKEEMKKILEQYDFSHYECHFGAMKTISKVLQLRIYWPTLFKDAHTLVSKCDRCQCCGNISTQNEMPRNYILEVEVFV